MGAYVEEIRVYHSEVPVDEEKQKQFLEKLSSGKVDAIIFGSGLCAKNLFTIFEGVASSERLAELLNRLDTVAIGPVTASTLATLNVKVTVTPAEHTFEQAVKALANTYVQREKEKMQGQ
jgi:uroporphyrinogen-III synthase